MQPIRTVASRFMPIALLVVGTGVTLSRDGPVIDNAVHADDGKSDGGNADEPKSNRRTFIDDKGFEVTVELEPIAPGPFSTVAFAMYCYPKGLRRCDLAVAPCDYWMP